MEIKKVAVIGAGTMGAGIAGQVANAGVEVWLLDLPTDNGTDAEGNPLSVNAVAERGLERLRDPDSPGLMSEEAESRIHLGNTRDDFHQLAGCDWVAEAIVERLDIKKDLYKRLDETCHDQAIITSNTSTIPIKLLVEDMPEAFQKRFAITHFFNPVRFMRLLELVRGEHTDPAVIDVLDAFCEERLGKGVVNCADTPGFLGNRVGVYAIQCALHAALDLGLKPAEADALFGRPMGIPKTGVFGLYDLIGIDLMSDVVQSLVNILPDGDSFHAEAGVVPLMSEMIANGQTGNKQGKGFYRTDEATNTRYVLDFDSGEYIESPRLNLPLAERAEAEGLHVLLEDDGLYGQFAWRVLSRTLTYAASLIPEVGDDPVPVDDAMKLGYNWIQGPFEMIDAIGVDAFIARLDADGIAVPDFLRQAAGSSFYRVSSTASDEVSAGASTDSADVAASAELQALQAGKIWKTISHPEGVVRFTEKRQTMKPENSNAVASWYNIDDVALVEFHSKANALDADSMALLEDAISNVSSQNLRGLIIHNDAQHFSCGVNLNGVREFFRNEDMDGLDQFLDHFQRTVHSMATADFPVVAAPSGMSLGGGFEVVLHAKQVICHSNSVMGLVESLVGVVPGGGGCKETLYRWVDQLGCGDDITKASWKAFMSLGYGRTASSPILAKKLAMLRDNDRFEMNRDRLYNKAFAAIDQATAGGDSSNGDSASGSTHTAGDQQAFNRPALVMPGETVFHDMVQWLKDGHAKGMFTPHDIVVGSEMARIVTGGEVAAGTLCTEQDLFDAERSSFLRLVATAGTRERINTMLDAGKPVRN
ncbi:3-hydroxyacyl-CoA dehydrogenase/enoyl-CoA hydratase family protein [Leucothrix pacifica]|nr:3-hydroxyacyl-CoA dehydrogenase/enoyl-CoA hydratase family protein [Leucothrix pacifica]